MSEKLIARFGFRARTAIALVLRRGEWLNIDEIMSITGLSFSSVSQALSFLVKNFPNLFEEKEGKFRFKGLIKRRVKR